jgi:L-ribulose-5-phosphate 3-epimerase
MRGSIQTNPIGIYEKALPPGLEWEERLDRFHQAGFDYAEISIDESDTRLARLDWHNSQRLALLRATANAGLPLRTLCLSAHRKYPLGSMDPLLRDAGLDILHKAIDFAANMGIRIVQIMGYDVFYEPASPDTFVNFFSAIQQGVNWAAAAGVMLGLENVDCQVTESIKSSLDFVREINSPWFQLYSDIGNLAAAGYNPASELPLATGHLIGLHIKDALPGVIRGVPFNHGIVPLANCFAALAQMGYHGLLTIEMWTTEDSPNPDAELSAARELIQGLASTAYVIQEGV